MKLKNGTIIQSKDKKTKVKREYVVYRDYIYEIKKVMVIKGIVRYDKIPVKKWDKEGREYHVINPCGNKWKVLHYGN